jgi:tetratricopeptide (TPR) repeat protein
MADEVTAYRTDKIRDLLEHAFTAEELERFCEDRPIFQPIVKRFGPSFGLDDMAEEVIDYCTSRELLGKLLAEVKRENPRQYKRHQPYVAEPGQSTGITVKPSLIAALAAVAALLTSLLTGLNQVAGFFSKITLPTAILSVLLAAAVAVALPVVLHRKRLETDLVLGKKPARVLALALAGLILLAGTGPFLVKYWIAAQNKSEGSDLVDHHLYAASLVPLGKAARYFDDLGLGKPAIESKLAWLQACDSLGDSTCAKRLIGEITDSGSLDGHSQAKLYTIQGSMNQLVGKYAEAEHFYQMAHQTVEPGSQAEAVLLQNEGALLAGKGAPYRDRVLDNYRRAREIYEALGDQIGLVGILINEGNLYQHDLAKARAFYEQAWTEAESLQDPVLQGTCAMNTGLTYRRQGDLEQAEGLYQQARSYFEEAADQVGQAEVMVNLAALEMSRGHRELARQYVQSAEAYLQRMDPDGAQTHARKVAQIRTFQADIQDELGASEAAEKLYQEALAIYEKNPDPLHEAETQVNYGAHLLRLRRGEEALNLIERAREILEVYGGEGPHETLAILHNNLGRAYHEMGDFGKALLHFTKAEELAQQLEDRLLTAQAMENTALAKAQSGDQSSVGLFLDAVDIYHQMGNWDDEVQALFRLYSFYTSSGDSHAPAMVAEILSVLDNHNIDQGTKAEILFGLLPQDIGDRADLIVHRSRLQQLQRFYQEREEPYGLGRSLQCLARVEQALGNYDKMVEYAKAAEAYGDYIPLPVSIPFHTDLGFYLLLSENPEDGIDHFLKAFDLAETVPVDQQRKLAIVINLYLGMYADQVNAEKYCAKTRNVLETASDPEIGRLFQEIADLLCN